MKYFTYFDQSAMGSHFTVHPVALRQILQICHGPHFTVHPLTIIIPFSSVENKAIDYILVYI